MGHWEELTFNDEFRIVGRGLTLTLNLEENNIKNSPISVGDTLIYKEKRYQITGIESFRNLVNHGRNKMVGLLVKEMI